MSRLVTLRSYSDSVGIRRGLFKQPFPERNVGNLLIIFFFFAFIIFCNDKKGVAFQFVTCFN